ncbi:nickel/cobalt efflux system [Pseudonocardia sulfidoxydans NBRC 16205]|uniref:Nickel/cobalt efflux system n=1 Tax=Pseudonocardia sulfidoxydans NBRC 16205 TaxID=1223511 RepID=A0A511DK47_9PSEU|nr:HoxN/HupN/NixA family nickel/cobalt transporter [Pseudonocardia sulfidoxydans]GEL25176.1 nickel/cobalt efflux system [Pseudonocardia sulfidoxydans NBRC 16205]
MSQPATARTRVRLQSAERRAVVAMTVALLALTVVGWGVLAVFVAPRHYDLGSTGAFGLGLGLTAYLLGMRHAFDADHIAAIDNTTRKLLAEREPGRSRPLSVGFWFALGHATVVLVLVALISLGVRAIAGEISDDDSSLKQIGGLVSTGVSGLFLVLLGLINLVILVQILRVFRDMRRGRYDEAQLQEHLDKRGLMNRVLGRATRAVREPHHMYPVGLLFGLGFDTASEVTLLVIAGGAAAGALPWYAVLVLPVLFAAGMCLFDTLDGAFMCFAYDWAFLRPVRKVFYNVTITALSVAVALVIGMIELLSLFADELGVESGPLAWVAGLDLDNVGFVVVGLFVLTWAVALAVWKLGRVEERWSAGLAARPEEG